MAQKPKINTGDVTADPLDIDRLLTNPNLKSRIARIGLEMEGGWAGAQPVGIKFERDGSVFKQAGDDGRYARREHPGYFFGEVNSGVVQPAAIPMFMRKYHPQLVDASCGLHVHMSFKTIGQYQTLTDPAYQETIVKYVAKWAEEEKLPATNTLWSRLKGESVYCQKKSWPDEQISSDKKDFDTKRPGHRYTMVNYCWRGGRQKTIEIRLLPMMPSWEIGARGIKRILDITNASLILLTSRKLCRETGKVIFRENDAYHEEITEVI